LIQNNTPIEKYGDIYVKREDLACFPPGPPFAKVRGLYSRLLALKAKGVETIGYTETSISMAGWGVAWMAKQLGMTAVIFNPIYKTPNEVLTLHRSKWIEFGAKMIDIPAGMAKVNYHISKNILREQYGPGAVMLPLGLPFIETIREVYLEFALSKCKKFNTIVMCVGSGTMAAGVLKGVLKTKSKAQVIGVLCRPSKKIRQKKSLILGMAGAVLNDDFFQMVDLGYEYTQKVDFFAPFPCNPYYDLKAYKFLMDYKETEYNNIRFKKPILFWNIGA